MLTLKSEGAQSAEEPFKHNKRRALIGLIFKFSDI